MPRWLGFLLRRAAGESGRPKGNRPTATVREDRSGRARARLRRPAPSNARAAPEPGASAETPSDAQSAPRPARPAPPPARATPEAPAWYAPSPANVPAPDVGRGYRRLILDGPADGARGGAGRRAGRPSLRDTAGRGEAGRVRDFVFQTPGPQQREEGGRY